MKDLIFKKVKTVLSDIENYTRYGAVFYDFEGKTRPHFSKAFCRLCSSCIENSKSYGNCIQNAREASYQSWLRGEAYIFKCWLGLYGIIIPISTEKDGQKISGAIEVGGLFPKGEFQRNLHQIISILNKIDPSGYMSSLVSVFQGVEELPQMDFATCADFIKEAVCSSGLIDSELFNINHETWQQQNRIFGRSADFNSISIDKEKLLCLIVLDIAKTIGNSSDKKLSAKVDEFLAAMSSWSGNDLKLAKAAIISALSIMRMYKLKHTNQGSDFPEVNFALEFENISRAENFQKLIIQFKKFISVERGNIKATKTETLKKVIKFIENNFHQNIRAEDTAKFAGASVSTIMHKIRKETGMTFAEYLNATRIKEAKRLLAYTDLSIGEISDRCGFSDQSYFSKVFFRHISISPREFRNMLFKSQIPKS